MTQKKNFVQDSMEKEKIIIDVKKLLSRNISYDSVLKYF